MRNIEFSISVRGAGVLQGPFFTESFGRWKQVTLYDHSGSTTAFRTAEAQLGEGGYLDAAGREHAKRIARNLKAPPPTDVIVEFAMKGTVQEVKITGPNGRVSNLRFETANMTMEQLDEFVRRIMRSVENKLGEGAKQGKLIG